MNRSETETQESEIGFAWVSEREGECAPFPAETMRALYLILYCGFDDESGAGTPVAAKKKT